MYNVIWNNFNISFFFIRQRNEEQMDNFPDTNFIPNKKDPDNVTWVSEISDLLIYQSLQSKVNQISMWTPETKLQCSADIERINANNNAKKDESEMLPKAPLIPWDIFFSSCCLAMIRARRSPERLWWLSSLRYISWVSGVMLPKHSLSMDSSKRSVNTASICPQPQRHSKALPQMYHLSFP